MGITGALKQLNINGLMSKEAVMASLSKVEYTLKGKKYASTFKSPAIADRFVKAAAEKWGPDFSQSGSTAITSDKSYINGEKPEHIKSAAEEEICLCGCSRDGHDEKGYCDKCADCPGYSPKKESTHKEGNRWLMHEISEKAKKEQKEKDEKKPAAKEATSQAEFIEEKRMGDDATVKNPKPVVKSQKDWVDKKRMETTAGFNFFFPGQALREFYPEMQHELVDYPNATNAPMTETQVDAPKGTNESMIGSIVGDPHENAELDMAINASFDEMTKLSYISTSPAGAAIGGVDVKSQTGEPDQFLSEDQLRGPGRFGEEFYQQHGDGPDAHAFLAGKSAANLGDKEKLGTFLKRVMAEIAATFIAAYKVMSRPPLDKVPGIGEIQLDQLEQQSTQSMASGLSLTISESRVKHLVHNLNDGEVQSCINDAWAQSAVWISSASGGMVYEVFVRAEQLDNESMALKYRFVTGYRDSSK